MYDNSKPAEFEVNFITLDGLKTSVTGRNYERDVLIGDVFHWIYRATFPDVAQLDRIHRYSDERPVLLRVEAIEAYHRTVDVLGHGTTGRLYLTGTEREWLKPFEKFPLSYDILRSERLTLETV